MVGLCWFALKMFILLFCNDDEEYTKMLMVVKKVIRRNFMMKLC